MQNIKYLISLIIVLLIASTTVSFSQNKINRSKLYSDFALKKSRQEYKNELNEKIKTVFSKE
ncbi:hypothetical protein MNBD_IGNAVI01-1504, partial [hydrothermal vent metagenome]